MSRYVDADALLATLYDADAITMRGAKIIREFPTVDIVLDMYDNSLPNVVEVIRCADCRCFQANMRQDGYLPNGVPEYECRWWCGEVDPTDYCSHAKRKDGGQDDEP